MFGFSGGDNLPYFPLILIDLSIYLTTKKFSGMMKKLRSLNEVGSENDVVAFVYEVYLDVDEYGLFLQVLLVRNMKAPAAMRPCQENHVISQSHEHTQKERKNRRVLCREQ